MRKTTAEIISELDRNPDHRSVVSEQMERLRKLQEQCDEDERELVRDLFQVGVEVSGVYDLLYTDGQYREAYPILNRHLKIKHHPNIREGIIRALTVRDAGKEIESSLLDELRSEEDDLMRWVLANALRTAMPYHRRKRHPEIQEAWEGYGNRNTEQGGAH